MTEYHKDKIAVWRNIYAFFIPHWKKFILIIFIGLLSTMANLLEPLIYREAINDVAGLFVKQAKDNAINTPNTANINDDDGLSSPFSKPGEYINNLFSGSKKESTDTIAKAKPPNNPKGTAPKKKARKKQPHTRTHVAGRTPEEAISTLLWAVVLLFLVNIIGYIFWLIADNMNVKLSSLIERNFIQNTFAHVLKLPLSFFSKRSPAAIAKQIDQSEQVSQIISGFSQTILPEIISLIGILAIMLTQNLPLTLISLAVIPFYILIAWRSARHLESGLDRYYENWENVSSRISSGLHGIKTVKLSGAEEDEVEYLSASSILAYNEYTKRQLLANRYTFLEGALKYIATALVLGYGGYLAIGNKLTPGDVVMFVAYLDRLYTPIDSLAELWVNMQQNIASITRAFRLFKQGTEEKTGKKLLISKGAIEFKAVHFSYDTTREILKGISFTAEPGKVTALVGPSGAGKTTAVDLLLKLFELNHGEILIDGQNLSEADASSVRSQIGMVSADGHVFPGSFADNIRYKVRTATDEEVHKAAISAGMKSTLQRLPEGLQTVVGESGIGLSYGERQRIQIARVILSKPKILILDEATSNLDFVSEAAIKSTIKKISKKTTVIIIAHRFRMIQDADKVVVLSDGEIIEQGTPVQLIGNNKWFAQFANTVEESANMLEEDIANEENKEEEAD